MKGKGKKPKGPMKTLKRAEPANPFAMVSAKRKFPILGVKVKQSKKNVIKARSEAVDKRKKTLLVEYRNMGKNNAFLDRRFGEHADGLSEEDKALLRLQRQRMRETKSSKFALVDGEDEDLTHLGASLGAGANFADLSDDEGDDLDPELTARMHFGGGEDDGEELFKQARRGAGPEAADEGEDRGQGEPGARPKTKKEVMEEIIAKSKLHRALKKRQREEDDEKLGEVDAMFREVMEGGGLVKRNKKKDLKAILKEEDRLADLAGTLDKSYDMLTRELAMEARAAQPGDRTRTAEEMAEAERQRLERLERERQRRMAAAGDDEEEDEGPDDLNKKGFAGRRARMDAAEERRERKLKRKVMESGDALDDEDFEAGSGSEGEEGSEGGSGDEDEDDEDMPEAKTDLERRQRARAAGDHPLQEAFREKAAELLARMIAKKKGLPMPPSKGDDDEEDDGEDDSELELASDEDGEGDSEEDDEEDEEDGDEGEELASEEEGGAAEAVPAPTAEKKRRKELDLDGPLDLPYVLPLPKDYAGLRSFLDDVRTEDVGAAVGRLVGSNRPELLQGSRKRMQELYGQLLQYFIEVAGRSPGPLAELARLDALVPTFIELTAEVPFYAATAFRARIDKLRDQLLRQERGEAGGTSVGPRAVCLLQLATTVFPPSDARHPVLTAALLLIHGFLSLGRLAGPVDVARGLVLAGLALRLVSPAERLAPEILRFLTTVLQWAVAELSAAGPKATAKLALIKLPLSELLSQDGSSPALQGPPFCANAASTAVDFLLRYCTLVEALPAAAELLQPLRTTLREFKDAKGASLPAVLGAKFEFLAARLEAIAAACIARRVPLVRTKPVAEVAVKQYNPRFEDADGPFALGKDYDPDRVRAEEKRMKRQINKETRAAMRELRRDAEFVGSVRMQEKAAFAASRDKSQKKALSFMQQQAADYKSGGQKGTNWKKGKGRGKR